MEKISISELAKAIHENAVNKGFHNDISSLKNLIDNKLIDAEQFNLLYIIALNSKLALITTEVAECTEALRKEDYKNFKEELADIAIRVFDLAELNGIDIEKEILDKVKKNASRPYLHNKRF